MKSTHLLLIGSLCIGSTTPAFAAPTEATRQQIAATQTQTLMAKIHRAIDIDAPDADRRRFAEEAARIISKLQPGERLLITEQLLVGLSQAANHERAMMSASNAMSVILAITGVVVLVTAARGNSVPSLAAGISALVFGGLINLEVVRPEKLEEHVNHLRMNLEELRDAQTLEIKSLELK